MFVIAEWLASSKSWFSSKLHIFRKNIDYYEIYDFKNTTALYIHIAKHVKIVEKSTIFNDFYVNFLTTSEIDPSAVIRLHYDWIGDRQSQILQDVQKFKK